MHTLRVSENELEQFAQSRVFELEVGMSSNNKCKSVTDKSSEVLS